MIGSELTKCASPPNARKPHIEVVRKWSIAKLSGIWKH